MGDDADVLTAPGSDPEAFLTNYLDSLVRTAFLLVGSHHAAEDLVMAAMLKCLPRWGSITGDPLPYVRKTILREYLARVRRLRVVRETATEVVPESGIVNEEDEVARRLDLLAALQLLPPRQRAVIVLRYLDDLPVSKVADLLQIAQGTVRSQIHDALATLRSMAIGSLHSYPLHVRSIDRSEDR